MPSHFPRPVSPVATVRTGLLTGLVLASLAGTAAAQAPAPAPPAPGTVPTTPAVDPGAVKPVSILDWGIVAIMVGAALFVVCRSSHRN